MSPGRWSAPFPSPQGFWGRSRKNQVALPSITVVTDHLVHSQWIHPFTDLYMVGSEFAKDQLLEQGVPEEKIAVTGIPISLKFAQARDREQALLELGLDPYYPLVLIMAGAEGMSPSLPRLCQILFRSSVPLQAAVITGRNKVLKEKLEGLRQKGGWPLYVLGYVDNVEVWMSAARVLVGQGRGPDHRRSPGFPAAPGHIPPGTRPGRRECRFPPPGGGCLLG
ncbi:MAG TPA: hypothetical protein ENM97_03515 [Moorella mulderi]|nr:hypothetical protein [Moorella mulderi]